MKGFANDPNVAPYVDDIYAYLQARADGVLGRVVRQGWKNSASVGLATSLRLVVNRRHVDQERRASSRIASAITSPSQLKVTRRCGAYRATREGPTFDRTA